jgi:hypothetical protein
VWDYAVLTDLEVEESSSINIIEVLLYICYTVIIIPGVRVKYKIFG